MSKLSILNVAVVFSFLPLSLQYIFSALFSLVLFLRSKMSSVVLLQYNKSSGAQSSWFYYLAKSTGTTDEVSLQQSNYSFDCCSYNLSLRFKFTLYLLYRNLSSIFDPFVSAPGVTHREQWAATSGYPLMVRITCWWINLLCLFLVDGGNRGTRRKPIQTREFKNANSKVKGPYCPGIKPGLFPFPSLRLFTSWPVYLLQRKQNKLMTC